MSGGIVGVLLAAGFSRRFGADKRWQPLADGTPLALASACKLRAACDEVVVVLRPEDAVLAEAVAGLGCRPLPFAGAVEGMGSSLAAGVTASREAEGWLVALADMPAIAPATYALLVAGLRQGAPLIAPSHQGQRGHPVGFSRHWRDELLALHGDQGARSLLQTHAVALRRVAVDDPGILLDIDAPADLAALKSAVDA